MAYQRKDQFDQYYLEPSNVPDTNAPIAPADDRPILPAGGGITLGTGDFISPNYARGSRGWKVDSSGNAEFQSLVVPTSQSTKIFTSSGTWTVPTGVTSILLTVVSGGGGGGGVAQGANFNSSGGGSGGYVIKYQANVSAGNVLTINVGAGGLGGAAGFNDGSPGGNSNVVGQVNTTGGGGGKGGNSNAAKNGGAAGSPNGTAAANVGVATAGAGAGSNFGIAGSAGTNSSGGNAKGGGAGGGGTIDGNIAPRAGGNGVPGSVTIEW